MVKIDVDSVAMEVATQVVAQLTASMETAATVDEVEDVLVPLLRRVGCLAAQAVIEAGSALLGRAAAARGASRHRSTEVTFSGVFGPMTVASPYLLFKTGGGLRPAAELGVTARGRSRRVERALLDFGSEESYAAASKRFEEHYGYAVERTAILRLAESHGARAEAFVTERLAAAVADYDRSLAERPGIDRCFVEMDGCELRTGRLEPLETDERTPVRGLQKCKRITEWRDTRMALVVPQGEVDPTYVGRLDTLDRVTEDLFGAAVTRGLSARTEVVACSDGGNGYRAALESKFANLRYVLDRPHLIQHLNDGAEAAGLTGDAKAAWVHRLAALCDGGHVDTVLAELTAYDGPGHERIAQLCGYVTRFQDAVHYDDYRDRGWPIGSGRIESCHRHIPQRRLKLPGTWWTPESLRRMLALRVIRANNWWDEFWTGELRAAA